MKSLNNTVVRSDRFFRQDATTITNKKEGLHKESHQEDHPAQNLHFLEFDSITKHVHSKGVFDIIMITSITLMRELYNHSQQQFR